jgi:hypothetical protein
MASENSGHNDRDDIPRSLFICDDNSTIPEEVLESWTKNRKILFGSSHPGEKFFKRRTERRK